MRGLMESLYLLMHRTTTGGLQDQHQWSAVDVPGVGKVLTREQAELHADELAPPAELLEAPGPRFLLPFTPETQPLAGSNPAMKLATEPGETAWRLGEIARADMVAILRAAASDPMPGGSTLSPEPDMFPVAASVVVERARQRFGPCDAHEIEARFDRLTMAVGGGRHGDAAFYQVPFAVMGFQR